MQRITRGRIFGPSPVQGGKGFAMSSKQIRKRLREIALKIVMAGGGCGGDCEKCRLHQSFSFQLSEGAEQEVKLRTRKPESRS